MSLLLNTTDLDISEDENGIQRYVTTEKGNAYVEGGLLSKFLKLAKYESLYVEPEMRIARWGINENLFLVPKETFILTYLFEGSFLSGFLKMNNINYQYIGLSKKEDGQVVFSEKMEYYPKYLQTIKEKIHIFENKNLNDIGKTRYALSSNWYTKELKKENYGEIDTLRRHINNYFREYMKEFSASDRMWSSFKKAIPKLRQKGYFRSDVPCNSRATNNYRNKKVLAYPINIFLQTQEKAILNKFNITMSDDNYALATMVQWIWRSAIRDGEDIYIYIPSKRMRDLLTNWIDSLSNQMSNVK